MAKNAFPFYGGNIKETFSLPSFEDSSDTEVGEISNDELDKRLRDIVKNF